jgi:hypothetical protein
MRVGGRIHTECSPMFKKIVYVLIITFSLQLSFADSLGLNPNSLKKGSTVKTPGGKKLKILERVGQGLRGVVFKVEDSHGHIYALKIAINGNKETLDSIGDEPKKMKDVDKLGIKVAKIKEYGKDYVLKEFISGTQADKWFREWVTAGADPKEKRFQAMVKLFEKAAKQKAYISDLNRKNLIWDGHGWIIIDSSHVRKGISRKKAMERFHRKMVRNFQKEIPCPKLLQLLKDA